MPAPLTRQEKIERGTFRPGEEKPPRKLHIVQRDIAKVTEELETAQRIAGRAAERIERDGKRVKTGRGARYSWKPNPACLQLEVAEQRIQSAKRQLTLLRDEESRALAIKAAEDAQPTIRPGLGDLSYTEADALQPPLSDDEWMYWLAATTPKYGATMIRQLRKRLRQLGRLK